MILNQRESKLLYNSVCISQLLELIEMLIWTTASIQPQAAHSQGDNIEHTPKPRLRHMKQDTGMITAALFPAYYTETATCNWVVITFTVRLHIPLRLVGVIVGFYNKTWAEVTVVVIKTELCRFLTPLLYIICTNHQCKTALRRHNMWICSPCCWISILSHSLTSEQSDSLAHPSFISWHFLPKSKKSV